MTVVNPRQRLIFGMLMTLLAACATSSGTGTSALLEQDYRNMSDARLTAYEQELGDELTRSAGGGPGGISLGFGFGTWGDHSGVGIGVDRYLGGGSDGAAALFARRDEVRAEMRRRGLLPADAGAP